MALFVLIFAAGMARNGTDFFPFTTDVPLYLRSDESRTRSDAIEAGKVIASAEREDNLFSFQQSYPYDENNDNLELILVFEAGDGASNMLTPTMLKSIHDYEMYIFSHEEFGKFCLKSYTAADQLILDQAIVSGVQSGCPPEPVPHCLCVWL